eukprot:TRINITY_DN2264_c0_g1_i1.p1 TRINITY_DN2264_c0_g1~~TRINITY_DN2264_c0_g1_i1.p1  ORF type:complete len:313 (+),score=62.85 TRINITY_DN2264_c0_g1_i1:2-940(+)
MALKFVIWFLLVAVTYGQFCGNGNLQTFFGEECDDNNRDDDDGCSGDCEIEDGWNCTKISGQTSKCKPICGDRKLHGYENCDDANTLPNDGCSSNCTIEVGWDCEKEDSNDPSVCSTICGDGLIKGTEQCDDNNTISDDGCERNCTISTNEDWLCLGEPSVCTVDDIEDDQENKGASKGTRAAIGVVLTLLVIGLVVAGIIIAMRMRPDLKEKAKEKFNAVTKRGGRNANRESHNPMYEARWQAVRHELYSVPELNFYTLKRLFGFCHKVTKNSKQTKMLPQNIAIVFHPTLNLPMELITSMVAKYEEIFAD